MLKINTERLTLIPLDIENYILYLEDTNKVEENLGLIVTNTVIEEPLKIAHHSRLKKVIENKNTYLWETNWLVVLKEENRIIGGIMIKGMPNENGEVIIGYGTDDSYQKKGYMTEAVNGLIEWIFESPSALSIIADTDKDNDPSHKVLMRNGFKKYKETTETSDEGEIEELVWWRLDKVHENK